MRGGKACTPKGEKGATMSDLISRESAVKTVIRKCSPICAWQVGTQQYPDCVVAEINALPSAEAEWIPVSERLPVKRRSVLITTSEDFVGEACYWATTKNHVIWKGYRWEATYWDDDVIAWQPLPTPYKESEAEE